MPQTKMIDVHDTRFIREKGFKALTRELGSVGTVYFLRQFYSGRGDWTADRKTELADISMNDIEKDIFYLRNNQGTLFPHSNIKDAEPR